MYTTLHYTKNCKTGSKEVDVERERERKSECEGIQNILRVKGTEWKTIILLKTKKSEF